MKWVISLIRGVSPIVILIFKTVTNLTKKKKKLFQMDLIKNKYHIFNSETVKKKGYYPRELLQMIEELPNFEKEFNIEVGEIYTVRAFFAISTGCYGTKFSKFIH